ncbi:hypothetical protein K443DRAFT_105360, partial [Laccaria amethystina LaAM-08-1]
KKLHDGCISVSGDDFPAFLYVPGSYNGDNLLIGCFRGPILVMTWRHIFQGPRSVLEATRRTAGTKAGQVRLHQMEYVMPRSIAYAVMHVFWFLYQYDDWHLDDGIFRINNFFNLVVETFELMGTKEWVSKTLGWWDQSLQSPTAN